ncbi:MAG: hypothetical protein IAG13_32820 [Deltaproteobacteria bacterium]|nr:hypothetical protein [Nannocystaceae bacterium]
MQPARIVFVIVLLTGSHARGEPSALWGADGELFDPAGPMMDWSYAGYHHGEDELPELVPTHEVVDFGAIGDGTTDDTAAFRDAIAAAEADGGGVVHAGPGAWVIADKLTLPDHVVLRGDGPGETTLMIPVSLTELYGNEGLDDGGSSSYAFSEAFIEGRGDVDGDAIATVTAAAVRGDTAIELGDASMLSVGQWIRITQTDEGGELMDRLHADLLPSGDDNVGDRGMNHHTRVSAIAGTTVTLERPLPVDIDLAWSPDVRAVTATVAEIGVEHLRIEFPLTEYPGHFEELGYNAIDFAEVAHAWVRDVEIVNADYGVNLRDAYFVTVADVVLDTTGDRGPLSGHHGFSNGHGNDNLFIGFDVRTTMVHDLTNEWYATGVVFTQGRGDDLRMDHHRAAPYTTLWTEIDCGEGASAFDSGGSSNRGPHTAAYDMLWNVRAAATMELPDDDFGPRMGFVGFHTDATEATSPYEWWFEAIAPGDIEPANIWLAMRERRLGPEGPDGTTGGSDDGGSHTGGVDSSTEEEGPGGDDGSDVDPDGSSDASASEGGAGTSDGASASDGDAGGCGCSSSSSGGTAMLGLVVLALRRRRR